MNKQKIYWNEDTIEYFADLYELNDFASLSKSILQFVIIDCDTTENTIQEFIKQNK